VIRAKRWSSQTVVAGPVPVLHKSLSAPSIEVVGVPMSQDMHSLT
jgi:hypothetical protein